MFLVYMPSVGGVNSVISQAVEIGKNDTSLNVIGAISDSKAMWGYEKAKPLPSGKKGKASSPHIFQQGGVSVIRATALTDRAIEREIGDFLNDETLSLGTAIIHDKLLVIDPLDPVNCAVAFGSHNFGFKASYSNDENLVIVKGHQALAVAYAVHVLDVYDHYRFRAKEAEKSSSGKGKPADRWKGFLDTTDGWQSKSSHRLARYFTP
ncbi:phospholipase D-like domain-containing protein (plasmid) [Rhizobium beringeri]|nr:phospholipase D-like domain-containing protein [Rhizobium beringeri]WSH17394.1 phospholipase D-like domain-containing protein [Rhizobium beringeri]